MAKQIKKEVTQAKVEKPKNTVHSTKVAPPPAPQTEVPEILLTGDQTIIGIGQGLVVDKEYNVSADIAMTLIKKGAAILKKQ